MKTVVEFFAHERDVTRIIAQIQSVVHHSRFSNLSVGNCGWANAPDCWWIRCEMDQPERREVVEWLIDNELELINPALVV